MRKQKGLAPIVIVVLVALAIGGYLIYQKQVKPVSVSQQVPQSTPATTSNSESTNSAASPALNGAGETANWKTYTSKNEKFKISFRYPETYLISDFGGDGVFFSESETDKKKLEDCFAKKTPECNDYALGVSFSSWDKNTNGSLENVIKKLTNDKITLYSETTVGGYKAFTRQFEGIGQVHNLFIDRPSDILYVEGNATINPKKNIQIYNKILSTFKFTQ